ncbi:MAG: hypothetical protein ACRBC3_16665 [Burkholderiaceae bacterium]
MINSIKRPAKEFDRNNTVGSQSAKSTRAFALSVLMSVLLTACGGWNDVNQDSASNNESAAEGASSTAVTATASAGSIPFSGAVTTDSGSVVTSAVTGEQQLQVTGLSCPAKTAPGPIKTRMVSASDPVAVPSNYMGLHRSLHTPAWMPDAYGEIPAPTYPYGIVRNLRVEVDGQEERGFWANIEVAPGVYDWSYMDKWAQANAGHPIMWMIYGTPSFYQKYPGEPARWPSWPGIGSPPTDAGHAALKRFAQAVKSRYGSQIAAFEVWNEPTLPWTGGVTSFNDRWSPSWGQANGQYHAPFFSGSASDLANIAYTLNTANLGVPVLGAAFADLWSTGATTVERFLNAPITLPGGYGVGKDHIQGLSTHFYDYNFNPEGLIQQTDGYRAKLVNAGVGHLPIWGSETGAEDGGVFQQYDWRAPINIKRWILIGAAKKLQSMVLYGHFSGTETWRFLGGPIRNQDVIATLADGFEIGGKTICDAAVLQDGRVWVTTAEGKDFLI